MPEKRQKPKPRRKPDDLRKRYPVDEILSQAETLTFAKLEKKLKLGKRILHTIVMRYGSDELKKKVSARSSRKKKEKKQEEQQQESLSNIKEYMQNLETHYTTLQTPTINLAVLANKLEMLTDRAIGMSVSGNAVAEEIRESLRAKDVDFEYIERMELSLRQFAATDIKMMRLAMQGCREQASIQEKYVKLEAVSRELQDVKTLIQYIFESYNILDDESYRKIKEYLTTLAPAVEAYFTHFEQSYNKYKAERIGQGNSGRAEAGKEETSGTKEVSN
jgi:hypothetical protein